MNECYRYVNCLFSCKLIEGFSFLNTTFGWCHVWKNVLLKFRSSVETVLDGLLYLQLAAFVVCVRSKNGKCCLDCKTE